MTAAILPIALHGVPRSGTTWLGEIFNSHPQVHYAFQPLFSYAYRDFLGQDPDAERIEQLWDELLQSDDSFINQAEKRANGCLPRFSKSSPSHMVYKEVRYHNMLPRLMARALRLRAVLIVRDPRAVISSWLRAPREFRADMGWSIENEWREAPSKNLDRPEEFNGYARWKDATRIFMSLNKVYPDRITLIRYSDLLEGSDTTVTSLFNLCGLDMSSQTRDFLNAGSGHNPSNPYGVDARRVCDDGWKNLLNPAIAEEIAEDLSGTNLATFLD